MLNPPTRKENKISSPFPPPHGGRLQRQERKHPEKNTHKISETKPEQAKPTEIFSPSPWQWPSAKTRAQAPWFSLFAHVKRSFPSRVYLCRSQLINRRGWRGQRFGLDARREEGASPQWGCDRRATKQPAQRSDVSCGFHFHDFSRFNAAACICELASWSVVKFLVHIITSNH
ncbi:MAG: hypothetical protein JWR26_58 [Pedosphaera sp.]|nr:hypothetical protein [Pedosphaera sp.]